MFQKMYKSTRKKINRRIRKMHKYSLSFNLEICTNKMLSALDFLHKLNDKATE